MPLVMAKGMFPDFSSGGSVQLYEADAGRLTASYALTRERSTAWIPPGTAVVG